MKIQNSRICLSCNASFSPLPQHPNQKFCSKPECQKERKLRTHSLKMQNDPSYQENQANANKRWWNKNPDYQRNYRKNKKKLNDNIDSSVKNSILISGDYRLTIFHLDEKMGVITIKLELISRS